MDEVVLDLGEGYGMVAADFKAMFEGSEFVVARYAVPFDLNVEPQNGLVVVTKSDDQLQEGDGSRRRSHPRPIASAAPHASAPRARIVRRRVRISRACDLHIQHANGHDVWSAAGREEGEGAFRRHRKGLDASGGGASARPMRAHTTRCLWRLLPFLPPSIRCVQTPRHPSHDPA